MVTNHTPSEWTSYAVYTNYFYDTSVIFSNFLSSHIGTFHRSDLIFISHDRRTDVIGIDCLCSILFFLHLWLHVFLIFSFLGALVCTVPSIVLYKYAYCDESVDGEQIRLSAQEKLTLQQAIVKSRDLVQRIKVQW